MMALLLVTFFGIRVVRVVAWRAPAVAEPAKDGLTRALVAMHIHTRENDGRETLDQIVADARSVGLQAVFITDHDSFGLAGRAGYEGDVLVMVGTERNVDCGHLLALGLPVPDFPPSFEGAGAVQDVHDAGGIAVAAHPRHPAYPNFRWSGPTDDLDGIEVENLDAAWRVPPRWDVLSSVMAYPFAPARAIAAAAHRQDDAIALFDHLLASRPALALAGTDAHRYYPAAFGALTDIVLLEHPLTRDATKDTSAIADALRHRRVLVAHQAIADARGCSFVARRGTESFLPGDVAPAGGGLDLLFATGLDHDADLTIVHDGRSVASVRGREIRFHASAEGAYRAEARLPGPFSIPWVFTNAICLAGSGWPKPPALPPVQVVRRPPRPREILASFVPAVDERSTLTVDGQDPPGGSPVVHAVYRLGAIDRTFHNVHCSMVDHGPLDLSPFLNLVIQARAARPMRLEVVLAVPARKEPDWMRRSIKLDTTTESIVLPLASFRSAETGKLAEPSDLTALQFLALTISASSAFPGSTGELWLESIRLEPRGDLAARARERRTSSLP